MPNLNGVPVPQYQANQPYHHSYDNLPLKALEKRDELINNVVDIHSVVLNDSSGTQGTLANRLAQSLQDNGDLHDYAVDQTQHNIAEHTDGSKSVSLDELNNYITLGYAVSNPVGFVRMLEAERDKLALVSDEATNLSIQIETISNIITVDDGTFKIADSSDIEWQTEEVSPGDYRFKPVLKISTTFAHEHNYDLAPILLTPGGVTYKVNTVASPYMENTLRVYVNGVRLSKGTNIYFPDSTAENWSLNFYTEDYANGRFSLNSAIDPSDVIRVDFDISLT